MTFDYSCSKPYKDLPLWLTKIYQTTKNQEFSLFDWLNQSDWTSWQEGKKLAVWSSLVDIACTPMLSYIFQSADYDQVSFNASSTSLVFAEWPCTHIWYWAFALKYSFPISFFDLSWSRTHFHRNEVPRSHHEFCERHAEEICKRVTFLYACIPFLFTCQYIPWNYSICYQSEKLSHWSFYSEYEHWWNMQVARTHCAKKSALSSVTK